MKKTLLFFVSLFALLFTGCKQLDRLLTFEIKSSDNIKVPASSLVNVPLIAPVPVAVKSQETFQNNNTNANLVKDVSLTRLTLTITDPATENFNFLKRITIFIGTSQSDKVPLAALDNVPAGISSIELQPAGSKLDKYIKAEQYTLYTEVELRSSVARELTLRADSRFKVTADPL